MRQNCWEFKKCGLGPDSANTIKIQTCPAALPGSYDGINKGVHAGRFCWAVSGTLCGGKIQGNFAGKLGSCIHCDFLKHVNDEEGRDFKLSPPKTNQVPQKKKMAKGL